MALALVVEDDTSTREMLAELLPALGHEVLVAATGRECLTLVAERRPDVILLDLGLPDVPGSAVITRLREWTDTPILVVSGSRQVRRKADALDAGADDFVDKPFEVSELRARLSVVERRLDAARERTTRRSFGDIDVDYTTHRVYQDGREIRLTKTEWLILEGLSREPGRMVTHRWLTTHVWGPHAGPETHQTMRAHVKTLRAKLGDEARTPRFIRTETGLGYRWISLPVAAASQRARDLRERLGILRDDARAWEWDDHDWSGAWSRAARHLDAAIEELAQADGPAPDTGPDDD